MQDNCKMNVNDIFLKNITIRYFLTYRCNYNCSYCCNKDSRAKYKNYEPTKNDINNMIDNLKKYSLNQLILFGGEPTVSENFNYIIEQAQEKLKLKVIKIHTNGSIIDPLLKIKNKSNVQICSTIHFRYFNDNIVKNNIQLSKHFNNYHLSLMLDDSQYENLKNFYYNYKTYFSNYWQLKIITDNPLIAYTSKEPSDKIKEICSLYNIPYESLVEYFHKNQWYGKICTSKYFSVLADGSYIPIPKECFNISAIDNLYNKNVNLFKTKPIICKSQNCNCNFPCKLNHC